MVSRPEPSVRTAYWSALRRGASLVPLGGVASRLVLD